MAAKPLFLSNERIGDTMRSDYSMTDPKGQEVHFAAFYPNLYASEHNGRPAIVVAPGFTEGIEVMSQFAVNLTQSHGQTMVLLDHHRRSQRGTLPQDHKERTVRAAAEGYLQAFGEASYDLMAHSEGGIHATRVALADEQVEALSLVAPAGYVDQSLPMMAQGAGREVVGMTLSRSLAPDQLRQMAKYILANSLLSLREGLSIPATDVREELEELRASGRPLGVVGFTRDRIIPADRLRRSLPDGVPFEYVEADHVEFLGDDEIGAEVYGLHKKFVDTRMVA